MVRQVDFRPLAIAVMLAPVFGACFVDFEEFSYTQVPIGGSGGTGPSTGGGPGVGGFTGGSGGMAQSTSSTGGAGPGGATQGGAGPGGAAQGGAGGGGMVTVACGATICDVSAGEICCVPPGMPQMASCFNGTTCPANGGEVSCDEPGDCPGGECCGDFMFGQTSGYTEVSCRPSCNNDITICDDDNDCDGNDTCDQSQYLPPGIQVCN